MIKLIEVGHRRIKKSQVAGKKQTFSVRLHAGIIEKIREKCRAQNITPGELIETIFQDG